MQGHKGHTSTLNFTISFNIFDNFKSVMVVYQDNCDLNLVHQSFLNVGDLSIRTKNCQYMGSTTVLKGQTFLLLASGRHYVTSTQRTQTFTKRIGFKIKHENKGSGRLFALLETKGNNSLESLICSFCFRLLENHAIRHFSLDPKYSSKQMCLEMIEQLEQTLRPYRPQMIQTVLELSGK